MGKKLDLRVLKTYKALKESFILLMNDKSFEDITVNELCEQALIRRATFYKHFADKYEFFEFIIIELQEEFESNIPLPETSEDLLNFYIRILCHLTDFLTENERLVKRMLSSSMLPTLLDILTEQIILDFSYKIKSEKSFYDRIGAPPEMIANFYTGALIYSVRYWMIQKKNISRDQLIKHMIHMVQFPSHPEK